MYGIFQFQKLILKILLESFALTPDMSPEYRDILIGGTANAQARVRLILLKYCRPNNRLMRQYSFLPEGVIMFKLRNNSVEDFSNQ
jgi:hypothetical protein